MSTINYAQREISCKIVYYGPGLGGKTTNLQFIHQSLPAQNRGELVSLATQQDRTLFFDFLPMDLGELKGFNTKFNLYTVPGQVYYNATRKLVLRGVDGIVFVADSQRDRMDENLKSLQNLRENLKEYGYELENMPWVIQYNKRDLDNISSVEEMEILLNKNHVPSFEGVAITGEGVKQILKTISSMVLERLKAVTEDSGILGQTPAAVKGEPDQESSAPKKVDLFPAARLAQIGDEESLLDEKKARKEKNPLDDILPLTQKSTIRWKWFKVGSADLRLSLLQPNDGRIKYRISGEMKILAFFRRSLDKRLIFRGKRKKDIQNLPRDIVYVTDPPEKRSPFEEPFCVWVEERRKGFYLSFDAGFGIIRMAPRGQPFPQLED